MIDQKILVIGILIILCVYLWSCRCKCNHGCHGKNGSGKYDNKTVHSVSLWLDHLLYTKLVVTGILKDEPSLTYNLGRLMLNQKQIAEALGPATETAVEKLLVEHISLAGKVTGDVKTSSENLNPDMKALYTNARQIGEFLDSKLPRDFVHHMKMHIDTLVAMVVAEFATLTGVATPLKFEEAIKTTDEYTKAGMQMAFDMAPLISGN